MSYEIAYLPGDGIGPEVAYAARRVLEYTAQKAGFELAFQEHPIGGLALDHFGVPCPDSTLEACLKVDAVLFGAVGGPQWEVGHVRPEAGLLRLRKEMGLFANLRPVKVYDGLEHLSPLKSAIARGVDMVIIRELTGGTYFGERSEGIAVANDNCTYSQEEVEAVCRTAFETARKRRGKVTSVDKANIMATSRLWRHAVTELHKAEFVDVELEHVLVDAMAMKLIQQPTQFDVIVTENLFGDILSDEASVLGGSIGLAPSASLGSGVKGLYEPIHGSAPDIAGENKANPVGAILSAAMLLRHSLQCDKEATEIDNAVTDALQDGHGTGDIKGTHSCTSFTDEVLSRL